MPLKTHLYFPGLLFLLTINSLNAQTVTREIGLRSGGFNDFDLIYKRQKAGHRFQRIRFLVANLSFQTTDVQDRYGVNLGIAIGTEKRKAISENLQWIHGWEPRLTARYDHLQNDAPNVNDANLLLIPGIGYVLGFQYNFSDNFYLSLESIPSMTASFSIRPGDSLESVSVDLGFSSLNVALTMAYSFTTEK